AANRLNLGRVGCPGQRHDDGDGGGAAPAGTPVDPASNGAGQDRAEAEEESAGTEGDVERHDFTPFRGWMGIGEVRICSSAPARTGGPCRPSQTLLRPANRSAIRARRTGMVVCVAPHWLAKTTGIPRSWATLLGIEPERGPTRPKSQCGTLVWRSA